MRVLTIVNPLSGHGDTDLYDYVRALGRSGAEVTLRFLGGSGALVDLLHDAESFDRVIAVGGDGTVSAVCGALAGSGIPVLAYPAGTANLVALNLDIPFDPLELARATMAGHTIPIDLGLLALDDFRHEVGFMVAAGAGYDAEIMATAERYKQALGPISYLVGALHHLNPTYAQFTLDLDGTVHTSEGMAILVMNLVKIQFDLPIASPSDPADGVFEVVVVRTKYVPDLIPAMWSVLLDRFIDNPDRSGRLEVHRASHVKVVADPPLKMQYDGEIVESKTPFTARILPAAARMIVPFGR